MSGVLDERSRSLTHCLDLCRVTGADEDGDEPLTPFGIGHTDDGSLGDAGMSEQHVLDLGGGDVLTAPDDGVVGRGPR